MSSRLAFVFSSQQFKSLLCSARHSWENVGDVVLSSHVLQRKYTESKELLCPYLIHSLRSSLLQGEKSLKKFDEQIAPNTSFIALRSVFFDIMETTKPQALQMNLLAGGNPVQMHCMGLRNWHELEAMERDAREAFVLSKSSIPKSQFVDRQEIPSVRLCRNPPKATRL